MSRFTFPPSYATNTWRVYYRTREHWRLQAEFENDQESEARECARNLVRCVRCRAALVAPHEVDPVETPRLGAVS